MQLTSKQKTIFEIVVALGAMLLVKDIADRFNVIGAGSIAMWTGIFVATIFTRKRGASWKQFGLSLPQGKRAWFSSLGQAFLAVILIVAFMGLVAPLISQVLGTPIPASSTDRFEFFLGKPLVFVAYLVIVIWVGAALGEELLMRGFLLNSLIAFFGDDKKALTAAVILHAIIFGSLHISQGITGVIATGCVAILFATFYLLNGRKLFPLILAHGIFNSIGLLAYYLSGGVVT